MIRALHKKSSLYNLNAQKKLVSMSILFCVIYGLRAIHMFVDAWDITFRYSDFGMELDWILVMVWDVPAILSVLVLNKNIMNERSKLDGIDSELD
jgi:hypothetical protein